ncbi:MAG: hypothetical protein LBT03_02220 [Holosporales bacterium]|nr:hypothetical protein [Holosporales bacterium]
MNLQYALLMAGIDQWPLGKALNIGELLYKKVITERLKRPFPEITVKGEYSNGGRLGQCEIPAGISAVTSAIARAAVEIAVQNDEIIELHEGIMSSQIAFAERRKKKGLEILPDRDGILSVAFTDDKWLQYEFSDSDKRQDRCLTPGEWQEGQMEICIKDIKTFQATPMNCLSELMREIRYERVPNILIGLRRMMQYWGYSFDLDLNGQRPVIVAPGQPDVEHPVNNEVREKIEQCLDFTELPRLASALREIGEEGKKVIDCFK